MRTKVLVCGANSPDGSIMLRTIADGSVDLFAADRTKEGPGMELLGKRARHVLPAGNDPGYLKSLLGFCSKKQITVIIPATDEHLDALREHEETLESRGIRFMAPTQASRELVADRAAMLERANQVVPTPKFAVYDDTFDATGWAFPLMLKPRRGGRVHGGTVVPNEASLENIPRNPDLMVEEILLGDPVYVDVMVSLSGEVLAAVPRTEVRDGAQDRTVARTWHDDLMEAAGRRVAEALGLSYGATLEFRRNGKDVPVLFNVRLRCSPATALVVASGVNIPMLCLKEILGEPIRRQELRFREVGMIKSNRPRPPVKRRRPMKIQPKLHA
ncbi:MAG: ATP-grasp domain-containing protein [Myxococcota bacterium]